MTAPAPIDVNQAFHNEQRGRIDAAVASAQERADRNEQYLKEFDQRIIDGRLKKLGGGRFQVNEPGTFDDGEILQRRTLVTGETVIVPQHGLATTEAGDVRLYSKVPVWHEMGNVLPGGTTDLDLVLKLAGLDHTYSKRPVKFAVSDGPSSLISTMPDSFVVMSDETKQGVGVVGKEFEIVQPKEVAELLLELVGRGEAVWESAGMSGDGTRVFFSLRLPEDIHIDVEGINDTIVPFVVAINSYNGRSRYRVVVTPWRPVCGNTERLALSDAITSWAGRHTKSVRDRVEDAREVLKMSSSYFDSFAREQNLLAQTDLEIDAFRALCDKVWTPPQPEAPERDRKSHRARLETLTELYVHNADTLGTTAYTAERAITEFLDWKTPAGLRGQYKGKGALARATAVLEGTHDGKKDAAHKQLLLRARR